MKKINNIMKNIKQNDTINLYIKVNNKYELVDTKKYDVIYNDYYDVLNWIKEVIYYNSDYEMLLFNYNPVIARIRDNDLYINITKYSQTTSKIQGLLKHLASSYNFNVIEYDGE